MRKIVLNLAVSLDGYISDVQGGFEWIGGHGDSTLDSENLYNFQEFLDSVDIVVMGSKAYEDCVLTGLNKFEDKEIIVATTRKLESKRNVRFISGNICEEIKKLTSENGNDIYLFGGAGLANHFIKENMIDEYIIGVIPTILGKGRRLFSNDNLMINLQLDQISITDGITILEYSKRNVIE